MDITSNRIEVLRVIRSYLGRRRDEWRAFALYGLGIALLGLVVPLMVQLLVNHLAFAGLRMSLVTLSVILAAALGAYQVCRYAQLLLLERLERQLVARYTPLFSGKPAKSQIIYFELMSLPKTLGKWSIDGFEILLGLLVGTLVLMVYHPFFIILVLILWGGLGVVYFLGRRGLFTAIQESASKYLGWYNLAANKEVDAKHWLRAREDHFKVLRRQYFVLMSLQVVGPLILLLGGAWLFELGQLSMGQFVAAELIGGALFVTLGKLGKFIETHYALMTSLLKIDHALEEGHE